jgi:hypothetical protein
MQDATQASPRREHACSVLVIQNKPSLRLMTVIAAVIVLGVTLFQLST